MMQTAGSGPVLVGGRLCLDFCNTVEYRETEHPHELLPNGYRSLVRWGLALSLLDPQNVEQLFQLDDADPEGTRPIFDKAVLLRETIYQLCKAAMEKRQPAPEQLEMFGGFVQQAMQQRALVATTEGNLKWTWCSKGQLDEMLWPITQSAAELLTSGDMHRVRQCPGCGWLFYDESRNRSRTWCDMRYCGNRAKARRFYERHKESPDE